MGVAGWAWSTHATVSASQEQTLSGRGARVYTCTCVHDNIPYRRLPKWADRRIPTNHKPSAGMTGPEGPAHRGWLGVVTGIRKADLNWKLCGLWGRSSVILNSIQLNFIDERIKTTTDVDIKINTN